MGSLTPIAADVTNEHQMKELVQILETQFGRLYVLVINAGRSTPTLVRPETGLRDWPFGLTEGSISTFREIMELNVTAPYLLMQSFTPMLSATTDGACAIIQLSSAAAHYTSGDMQAGGYTLSKFAVTRLVQLAHEAHHERDGIRAFPFQPGGVKTDLAKDLPEGKGWQERLIDGVGLCGGVCVWLTRERRDWLSGRYLDSRWDFAELERKRDEIVAGDLLKFRLAM
jgi:NAD(P)-dependent dehydrogenase (short-subunit alcohol dehydrogenase family)